MHGYSAYAYRQQMISWGWAESPTSRAANTARWHVHSSRLVLLCPCTECWLFAVLHRSWQVALAGGDPGPDTASLLQGVLVSSKSLIRVHCVLRLPPACLHQLVTPRVAKGRVSTPAFATCCAFLTHPPSACDLHPCRPPPSPSLPGINSPASPGWVLRLQPIQVGVGHPPPLPFNLTSSLPTSLPSGRTPKPMASLAALAAFIPALPPASPSSGLREGPRSPGARASNSPGRVRKRFSTPGAAVGAGAGARLGG